MAQNLDETDLQQMFQLLAKSVMDIPGIKQQQLCFFFSDQEVRDVFVTLVQSRISAAPVWDRTQKKWIGLVDMKDFVAYILHLFGRRTQIATSKLIAIEHSGELVDFSKKNRFEPTREDASSEHVLKTMAHHELHRMPVVSKTNPDHIIAMVSQSTIVGWLVDNEEQLCKKFTTQSKNSK